MGNEPQKMLGNLWVRVILLGCSILIFLALCYFLRGTIISLFLAFSVAYIFNPVVSFFERRHILRGFGIVIIITTVLLITAGFLTYAVPKTVSGIYQVGGTIKKQYPNYRTTVEAWIKKYEDSEFAKSIESLINDRIEKIKPKDTKENETQGLPSTQEENIEKEPPLQKIPFVDVVWGLKKYTPQVLGILMHVTKNIFYSTFGFLGIVINFIIFGVVSVYLLKDFNIIAEKIKDLFPLSKREQAINLLSKVNDNLRYFLRGQLIICFILSLIYSIGLTITGIPLSFLIGFIGGFGNLIPYVGTGAGIVLASTLALFQFHDVKHIVFVIITFGIGQLLEGTVITPRIMGKGLGLSPVMVILSILICSQLLGFLGLLLAVPIAATVKVFVDEFISKYKSSRYYRG